MFPSSTEDLLFQLWYEHLSSDKYLFNITAKETVTY